MSILLVVQMLENQPLSIVLLKEVTGEGDVITTSHFPGTTLDIIEIPLSDGRVLVDTPGIINHHQMAHFVDKRDLKVITPKKEIKPKVYQLNEGQTLFFGGLDDLIILKAVVGPFPVIFQMN